MRREIAASFDALAEVVFASRERLSPLLARFDEEVGRPREDDRDLRLLQAIRTDWALCEAELEGVGDTWATRSYRGVVEGVGPEQALAAASSLASVFEVSVSGAHVWLRDALHGSCFRLLDPVGLFEPKDAAIAMWELRIVPDPVRDGVHMVRQPLRYPAALADELEAGHAQRFIGAGNPRLQRLRKARLHWARSGERFWRCS